jgi:hypothetical protein
VVADAVLFVGGAKRERGDYRACRRVRIGADVNRARAKAVQVCCRLNCAVRAAGARRAVGMIVNVESWGHGESKRDWSGWRVRWPYMWGGGLYTYNRAECG